jgi:hypothetical protein
MTVKNETDRVRHRSPSQLAMYLRCGEAYRRRYIEGEIIPPGVALLRGSAVHKGAEVNFRQKIKTYEDLPPSVIQEAAATAFDERASGEVMLSTEETSIGLRKVLGDAKDSTVRLADLYAVRVAPTIQPLLVEERVEIPIPDHPTLVGIIDVVSDTEEVVDLKTSKRRKPENEVEIDDQLTWYDLAYRYHVGRAPKSVGLEVLIDKKVPDVQSVRTQRTKADHDTLIHKLNAMEAGIKVGVFLPAAPGSWACSERFCGYWNTCPFVNSQRRSAA